MEFEKEQIIRRLANDGKFKGITVTSEHGAAQEFRNWVKLILGKNIVLIEFEKVDGTTRIIKCTLSEEFGAKHATTEKDPATVTEKETPKKKNEDTCAVWDIEKSAWRSFRWSKIKKIDFKVS